MKIIIAGAHLTGLSYALLLKKMKYDVELYEKRPESDIEKLDSMIYLTDKSLTALDEFIGEDLFSGPNPQALKEMANPATFLDEDHAIVNTRLLALSLRKQVENAGILIHYSQELDTFAKPDSKTHATFVNPQGKTTEVECDQLLIATGGKEIRKILNKNGHKLPVDLYKANLLGTRMPLVDAHDLINSNIAQAAIKPEVSSFGMIKAQLLAGLINYSPASIGYLAFYFASLQQFGFAMTYPPKMQDKFENDKTAACEFLREHFKTMITRLQADERLKDKDFSWLKQYISKINEDNVDPFVTFAAISLPDMDLLNKGVIVVGDAFVTAPYIFGSEFNHHLHYAFPILLNYLNALRDTTNKNSPSLAKDFFDNLWKLILDKKGFAKFFGMSDLMGNTVYQDGSLVNVCQTRGFEYTREMLEALRDHGKPWIYTPEYQAGGFVTVRDSSSQAELRRTLPDTSDNNYTYVTSAGLFARPSAKLVKHLPDNLCIPTKGKHSASSALRE